MIGINHVAVISAALCINNIMLGRRPDVMQDTNSYIDNTL